MKEIEKKTIVNDDEEENAVEVEDVSSKNIEKETKKYKKLKTKKSCTSFDEFRDYQTRLWQISFIEDKEKWCTSTCNCSQNQKNYICKHVILQAIRLKYVEVPTAAKIIPLHDMPKRGRPARVSKALQIDNEKPSTIKSKQLKRKHDSSQPTTSKRAMN